MTCPLAATANFVPGQGPAPARLAIYGEAPGYYENRKRQPFIGDSGVRLVALLEILGLGREEVFISNIEKFRPPKNRKPKVVEILACEKHTMLELKRVNPKVILAMGATAAEWFDPTLKITKDHGYPRQVVVERSLQQLAKGAAQGKRLTKKEARSVSLPIRWSGIVVPMYHPAYTLRNPNLWPELAEDFRQLQRRLDKFGQPIVPPRYWLEDNEGALAYLRGAT